MTNPYLDKSVKTNMVYGEDIMFHYTLDYWPKDLYVHTNTLDTHTHKHTRHTHKHK